MTEPNLVSDDAVRSDRRGFLKRSALGAGAVWTLSLDAFRARHAEGAPLAPLPYGPYGQISPKADEATGLPLLLLPDGFRYISYSWTGDVMSDGIKCPSLHDGMGIIDELNGNQRDRWEGPQRGRRRARNSNRWEKDDPRHGHDDEDESESGLLVLCRNHEGAEGAAFLMRPDITYDAKNGAGGNSNLIFDATNGRWLAAYSTLAGLVRPCAGGVTPWNTWVTCEETAVDGHGWTFEVGTFNGNPAPIRAMGRFSHEALMVDPRTGYVYETEDSDRAGFYKFVPNRRGQLSGGGKLYMLKIWKEDNVKLGEAFDIGTTWNTTWVRVDDPSAASQSCFEQGFAKGGAEFRRLEGAWWGDRIGYFLSTNGGVAGEGQVFEYDPRREKLTLIYDSPNSDELDNPDNITVTPRGGLLLCEDAAGNGFTAGERLIGLTLDGETFTFAQNNINLTANQIAAAGKSVSPGNFTQQEWAGACFSPDGRWLFVNIQTPGITFAITGPWERGPL